jgi:parallel beta-helix repeat protein
MTLKSYTFVLVLAGMLASQATLAAIVSPAYYVAPGGSDSNNGLSTAAPFQTLERAQAAMEDSNVKTTYLLAGTYTRTKVLALQKVDSGETWEAYPGQTPVLDGGTVTKGAIFIHADNVSIKWLTIQNFFATGITVHAVSNLTISNNTIKNITCDGWNEGAIFAMGRLSTGVIAHNFIINSQFGGISYGNNAPERVDNLLIDSNAVFDTCLTIKDCGAIYADDRDHSARGITITNNIIGNYGPNANWNKAIYLDAALSHTTVKNNIVYGSGEEAIHIHGGDRNVIENNIFDISAAAFLGFYQYDASKAPHFGMAENTFTCNIVYSSKARSAPLWKSELISGEAPLIDTQNLYWDSSGKPLPNMAPIKDTQPTVADPGFVNPGRANYSFRSAQPPVFCNFQPIDTSKVGPLPNE